MKRQKCRIFIFSRNIYLPFYHFHTWTNHSLTRRSRKLLRPMEMQISVFTSFLENIGESATSSSKASVQWDNAPFNIDNIWKLFLCFSPKLMKDFRLLTIRCDTTVTKKSRRWTEPLHYNGRPIHTIETKSIFCDETNHFCIVQ